MNPLPPDFGYHSKETIMESLQLLFLALAFFIGLAAGWWSYRYTLKRDPARLEELAAKLRKVRE